MNRLLPFMIAVSACSLGDGRGEAMSSGGQDGAMDSGTFAPGGGDGSSDTASGAELAPAAWWRLGAELELGEPLSPAEGSLTNAVGGRLTVVSLDEAEGGRCTAEAGSERLTLLAHPEPELVAWWLVVAGDWAGTCVDQGASVPLSTLQLGVGSLHPELLAVLGSVSAAGDGSERTLNGAYARFDADAPVYAFGLAGPASAYAGVGEQAVAPPLEEGTWLIEPAYSFVAGEGW